MIETLSATIPEDIERLVHRVLDQACRQDIKLTAAESCTGGLLASLLTDIEGCSHAFERGFVVYSEQSKCDLLGIAEEEIERCGAVSREVAIAMAHGAIAASDADIALAITGFAGEGNEPGLVHFACATASGTFAHRESRFGDIGRGPIRIAAIRVALEMMEQALAACPRQATTATPMAT
jgi:competence/damage-inducible protein CinA C-terminal domain